MRTLKLDKVILKVPTFHCTIAVFVRKIVLFFAKTTFIVLRDVCSQ